MEEKIMVQQAVLQSMYCGFALQHMKYFRNIESYVTTTQKNAAMYGPFSRTGI